MPFYALPSASLVGGRGAEARLEPLGDCSLVEVARGDGEDSVDRVVGCRDHFVGVERAEHDERLRGEPLVAVDERVVLGDADHEHGGLVDAVGIEVLVAQAGSGGVQRGVEKIESSRAGEGPDVGADG